MKIGYNSEQVSGPGSFEFRSTVSRRYYQTSSQGVLTQVILINFQVSKREWTPIILTADVLKDSQNSLHDVLKIRENLKNVLKFCQNTNG